MKLNKVFIGLFISTVFLSCNNDDTIIDEEQKIKSYELIEIQWKLNSKDGQSIIEEKLPEFHFRNDSDTIIEIVIDPLENLQGSSKFKFRDSLLFTKIQFSEFQVAIPKELSLLSEEYSYLNSGIKVPLAKEESTFPFSYNLKTTYSLNRKSTLTSKYTLFLRKNEASFLATFRETSTGETLELDGIWSGIFFNNIEVESVANEIE